jgi:hypothetical protein
LSGWEEQAPSRRAHARVISKRVGRRFCVFTVFRTIIVPW